MKSIINLELAQTSHKSNSTWNFVNKKSIELVTNFDTIFLNPASLSLAGSWSILTTIIEVKALNYNKCDCVAHNSTNTKLIGTTFTLTRLQAFDDIVSFKNIILQYFCSIRHIHYKKIQFLWQNVKSINALLFRNRFYLIFKIEMMFAVSYEMKQIFTQTTV